MHSWRCVHFFIFLRVLTLECHHLQYSGRLIKNGDYNETVINLKRGNRIPSKKENIYLLLDSSNLFIYLVSGIYFKRNFIIRYVHMVFCSTWFFSHLLIHFINALILSTNRLQAKNGSKNVDLKKKLRLHTIWPINQIIKYSATGQ